MDPRTRSISDSLLPLLVVALLAAYLYVPDGATPFVIWLCLGIFYVLFAGALRHPQFIHPRIPTFVTLEVLFLAFSYALFFYPYQLYVLGIGDLERSQYFQNTFAQASNRAVLLAVVGMLTFTMGARSVDKRSGLYSERPESPVRGDMDENLAPVVFVAQLLLIVAYLAAGFRSAGEGRYSGSTTGGAAAEALAVIIVMLCMISVGLFVARTRRGSGISLTSAASLAVSVAWALRLALYGDRNSFLLIALVGIIGFSTFRFAVGRLGLIAMILVAITIYGALEVVRSSADSSLLHRASLLVSPDPSTKDEDESSLNITTVTLRASLEVVPDRYDYGYGRYKVIGVAGIVPFSRGILLKNDDGYYATSKVLGAALLRPKATWGVGSNIISDIYMDFGPFGVPVLMYGLGAIASAIRRRVIRDPMSSRHIVLYLVSASLVAELPRYTIDFPIRILVWTTVIFWSWRAVTEGIARKSALVPRRASSERITETTTGSTSARRRVD